MKRLTSILAPSGFTSSLVEPRSTVSTLTVSSGLRRAAAGAMFAILLSCSPSAVCAQLVLDRHEPVQAPVDPFEALPSTERGRKETPTSPPAPVDPFESRVGQPTENSTSALAPSLMPTRPDQLRQLSFETECPSAEEENSPFEYRRSWAFYLLTQDARTCSKAVQELRTLSKAFRDGTKDPNADMVLGDRTFLGDSKNAYARGIVERYVNSCSYSLSDARAITHLTTEENIQKIRKALGVVRVGENTCMATVVAGNILTARHCFGIAPTDGSPEVSTKAEFTSLDSTVKLQVMANQKQTLLSPNSLDEDWIALKIADQPVGGTLSLPFAPQLARRWQPLILISVSGYAQALANENSTSSDVVRIDISPKCVVQARERQFIYHSCQTLRGMSGAPLLTMMGTELTVVGVHSGVSSGIRSTCSAKLSQKYINYGVVPSAFP